MAQVEEAPSPRDPDVAEAALLFELGVVAE